jgi:hypothetical protein
MAEAAPGYSHVRSYASIWFRALIFRPEPEPTVPNVSSGTVLHSPFFNPMPFFGGFLLVQKLVTGDDLIGRSI